MKKFTLIVLALFAGIMFTNNTTAQNLVLNADLELWDDAQNPTDWDKAENIEQCTATIHGGTYSAKHISASGTKDFQQVVEGITGGSNYNISYFFYDNDAMARTRIWAYWLSGDQTLDDHAEILRPGEYSEDADQWILWQQTLTAPAAADGFRFEVRVYKQDEQAGGAVYYDDFTIEVAGVSPEPTNYPTDFAAAAAGLNINLSWTDATGDELPSGYLILAESEAAKWDLPVDGTPVADDTDLSDGMGALNVPFGNQACTFSGLDGATTYNFVIFPYSNGGENIDYKTDGTPPETSAETVGATVITQNDFNDGWGEWTYMSVVGQEIWEISPTYGIDDTPCAKMSGYSGSAMDNEDWLFSPMMNLDNYANEVFTFYSAQNYSGPQLEVLYSSDYAGNGDDPNNATWTALEPTLSAGGWDWTASGEIDLSAVEGENVTIAFKYTSTTGGAATWEVDNIMLLGEHEVGTNELENVSFSVYPNPATSVISVNTNKNGLVQIISLTGEVLLEEYTENNLTMDISSLPAGIYLVKYAALNENSFKINKLIVK